MSNEVSWNSGVRPRFSAIAFRRRRRSRWRRAAGPLERRVRGVGPDEQRALGDQPEVLRARRGLRAGVRGLVVVTAAGRHQPGREQRQERDQQPKSSSSHRASGPFPALVPLNPVVAQDTPDRNALRLPALEPQAEFLLPALEHPALAVAGGRRRSRSRLPRAVGERRQGRVAAALDRRLAGGRPVDQQQLDPRLRQPGERPPGVPQAPALGERMALSGASITVAISARLSAASCIRQSCAQAGLCSRLWTSPSPSSRSAARSRRAAPGAALDDPARAALELGRARPRAPRRRATSRVGLQRRARCEQARASERSWRAVRSSRSRAQPRCGSVYLSRKDRAVDRGS